MPGLGEAGAVSLCTAHAVAVDGTRSLVGAVEAGSFGPPATLERVLVELAPGNLAWLTSAAGRSYRLWRIVRTDDDDGSPVALYRKW